MSRRKSWGPSDAKLVRLRRDMPGSWQYYFPGWRKVPALLWHVQRRPNGRYEISACMFPEHEPSTFSTLADVRGFIARHYEYLPKP
jgi:hypothetical protein